ncbi:transposon Tf2-1 polyprotein isoform X1 [Cucumis melo var. makuwa]|uniref:Transposon Tf2-1 polyprotein isoform X1 n=1 Tax=Cucumis melo var. makuwa TaxID=1194695 RepID=A0A5A7T4F5_CUCMM|nr:transposon Tf2-1 polyprotein isoform X1 [Cucumis melo var. makuwa]TYJ97051.1 transposon Tf2-1 polyprotein isoform X1 [Cucumis melo var. makuwa]
MANSCKCERSKRVPWADRNAMMTIPVLALLDFNLPFEIETYALGELMAVVLAVQRWRPYLLGRKFVVKADFVYKPGLENRAADALSRMPPSVHLYNLTAPTLIDLVVIKEVEKDEHLKEIIAKSEKEEGVCNYSMQHGMLRSATLNDGLILKFVGRSTLVSVGAEPLQNLKWTHALVWDFGMMTSLEIHSAIASASILISTTEGRLAKSKTNSAWGKAKSYCFGLSPLRHRMRLPRVRLVTSVWLSV